MSLSNLDRMMDWASYGAPTWTGRAVSQTSALQTSAVWACVDRRAKDIARAPLYPFRRTGKVLTSGHFERELATDHYLWPLITHQANPEQTAYRFRNQMQAWYDLNGNAYAEIEISGRGQVKALWPWRSDRVSVDRPTMSGPLVYTYRFGNGEQVSVPAERMLHLRGLSLDGVKGLSRIEMHRQGIGLAQALQEQAARFFGNGARPLGLLRHPGRLSKEGGPEEVRKNWEMVHGGLQNSSRIAILQEGMDYKEIGLNMVDAQYLESQNFSVTDICRIFGMPPHLVGQLDRSTNNNIEHQGLEYVQYGLGPDGANWQNELAFSLLSPREADSIFLEFSFKHLLQGDLKAQAEFYSAMIQNGVFAPDEAREDLGYNPFPNGWGAVPMVQLNMRKATDPAPDPNRPHVPGVKPAAPVNTPQQINGLAH